MEKEQDEEIKADLPSESQADVEPSEQDPLKTELEKVQNKGKSKVEKLIYTKKRINDQLKDLGIEDEEDTDDEDSKPVTMATLKKFQAEAASKTALQLADEIPNETERELTKHYLQNTIRSTGDPKQDLDLARGLVNAVKNRQIIEETNRKPESSNRSSGAGAPAKREQKEDFTPEELGYMKPPFSLTKEQVIAARPK